MRSDEPYVHFFRDTASVIVEVNSGLEIASAFGNFQVREPSDLPRRVDLLINLEYPRPSIFPACLYRFTLGHRKLFACGRPSKQRARCTPLPKSVCRSIWKSVAGHRLSGGRSTDSPGTTNIRQSVLTAENPQEIEGRPRIVGSGIRSLESFPG